MIIYIITSTNNIVVLPHSKTQHQMNSFPMHFNKRLTIQHHYFLTKDCVISRGPPVYKIYILNKRCVSSFATCYPWGVLGHGWTTCLLYDVPLLGFGFQNVFVCSFGILEGKFLPIYYPCLCFFVHYPRFSYYLSAYFYLRNNFLLHVLSTLYCHIPYT